MPFGPFASRSARVRLALRRDGSLTPQREPDTTGSLRVAISAGAVVLAGFASLAVLLGS